MVNHNTESYSYDNIWNVPVDLRSEFNGLLKEFGINVLYVNNCKFVRCTCFNDLNKTGDPNCKKCFGTGHFASVTKIPVIESSNSPYSTTNGIRNLPIGTTDQKDEIYYIQHQYNPKERDMILKVTWDKKGNPVDILKVLEITNVWEHRGDAGRLELFACSVNDRTDLVKPYNNIIKSMNHKLLYQIFNGGKSIWPANLLP